MLLELLSLYLLIGFELFSFTLMCIPDILELTIIALVGGVEWWILESLHDSLMSLTILIQLLSTLIELHLHELHFLLHECLILFTLIAALLELFFLVLQGILHDLKLLGKVLRYLTRIGLALLRPILFIAFEFTNFPLQWLHLLRQLSVHRRNTLLLRDESFDLIFILLILIVELSLQFIQFLLHVIHLLM